MLVEAARQLLPIVDNHLDLISSYFPAVTPTLARSDPDEEKERESAKGKEKGEPEKERTNWVQILEDGYSDPYNKLLQRHNTAGVDVDSDARRTRPEESPYFSPLPLSDNDDDPYSHSVNPDQFSESPLMRLAALEAGRSSEESLLVCSFYDTLNHLSLILFQKITEGPTSRKKRALRDSILTQLTPKQHNIPPGTQNQQRSTTRLQNAIKWCRTHNEKLGYAVETCSAELAAPTATKEALLGLLYTAAENVIRANTTLHSLQTTYPLCTLLLNSSSNDTALPLMKSFHDVETATDTLALLVNRFSSYEVLQSTTSSLLSATKKNMPHLQETLSEDDWNELDVAVQSAQLRVGIGFDRGNTR